MNRRWKWFLPGYLLALPGTLFGLLMFIWYQPSSVKFVDGCIEAIPRKNLLIGGRWVGGQTFGNVIFFRDKESQNSVRLRVHERVHTWQAMVLTWPLFMLLYGIHFLVLLPREDNWVAAYRKIFAEKQAYRIDADYSDNAWGTRT